MADFRYNQSVALAAENTPTHTFENTLGSYGLYQGFGTPENVIVAPVSSLYVDMTDGSMYKKSSGTLETGWVSIAAGGGTANIGDTVGGSTDGSILFIGSGNLSQDNGQLYFDNTNNRLGLGTTTPNAKLTIVADVDQPLLDITPVALQTNDVARFRSYAGVSITRVTNYGTLLLSSHTNQPGGSPVILSVSSTMSGAAVAEQTGSTFDFFGSGATASGFSTIATKTTMQAGYTGTDTTIGVQGNNLSVATGLNLGGQFNSTATAGTNIGVSGVGTGATNGVGILGTAAGSTFSSAGFFSKPLSTNGNYGLVIQKDSLTTSSPSGYTAFLTVETNGAADNFADLRVSGIQKIAFTPSSQVMLTRAAPSASAWQQMADGTGTVTIHAGSGSPETVVTAAPGSLYLDYTNGLSYVKRTGVAAIGWSIQSVGGRVTVRETAVNTTTTVNDYIIGVTDTTAPRIVTVSTADIALPGRNFLIKDMSGTCSTTNTITVVGQGGELIDGLASVALYVPYASITLYSNLAGTALFSL